MEPPFTQLSALIPALAQAVCPLLDKPFAIFGHSLGALVGFELARHLRRQHGLHPVRLFISAGRAPQIPQRDLPMHTLLDREFVAKLRRLNGTPKEVFEHAELMEIVLPLLRADFAMYETYVYTIEPPLNCHISTFGGLLDPDVSQGDLDAWGEQTTGSFSSRRFPGDHFFVNTTERLLLEVLSQELRASV